MKKVPLTQGYEAIVDDDDYEIVSRYKWHTHITRDGRIYANRKGPKGKAPISMHRFLMSALKGQMVDHKNTDGLDNRRENLRFCTRSQNQWNQKPVNYGTSKYKGVCRSTTPGKWRAYIRVNDRGRSLGAYWTEEEAAKAYDEAARRYFGEFARPNFLTEVV